MHKIISFHSTFWCRGGELVWKWGKDRMKVFLGNFCVFLRNVSIHEENGFMCIVRKSGHSNLRNAVFLNHYWRCSFLVWDLAHCQVVEIMESSKVFSLPVGLDLQMLVTTRSVRSFTSILSQRCVTVLGTIEDFVDTGRHVDTDTSERSSVSTIWQDSVQVNSKICLIY